MALDKSGRANSRSERGVGNIYQRLDEARRQREQALDTPAPAPKRHGIDIVLGAQWGDEGKGKLVDMLSQVRDIGRCFLCCRGDFDV